MNPKTKLLGLLIKARDREPDTSHIRVSWINEGYHISAVFADKPQAALDYAATIEERGIVFHGEIQWVVAFGVPREKLTTGERQLYERMIYGG